MPKKKQTTKAAVKEVELIRDAYGQPYPEEVQRLAQCVLPTLSHSVDDLIQEAIHAAILQERARDPFSPTTP